MEKLMKLTRGCFLMFMISMMALGAVSTMGCAGKTKTSSVTTQSTGGANSTTTTTQSQVVTTDAHPRGVIGGLFYTIGQVIIWPFKVIGSLF